MFVRKNSYFRGNLYSFVRNSIKDVIRAASIELWPTPFATSASPPVFSETPSWLLLIPQVNLELAKSVESTTPPSPSQCRVLLTQIIDSCNKPIVCYTDGSKCKNRVGYAFSINNQIQLVRHKYSATIHTAPVSYTHLTLPTIYSV